MEDFSISPPQCLRILNRQLWITNFVPPSVSRYGCHRLQQLRHELDPHLPVKSSRIVCQKNLKWKEPEDASDRSCSPSWKFHVPESWEHIRARSFVFAKKKVSATTYATFEVSVLITSCTSKFPWNWQGRAVGAEWQCSPSEKCWHVYFETFALLSSVQSGLTVATLAMERWTWVAVPISCSASPQIYLAVLLLVQLSRYYYYYYC
jgi:hypothetical protein